MPIELHLEALRARVAAAAQDCPGIAWAVVADGRLAHAEATGRHPGGLPADPARPYRIASMTKSFTAAAVLLLRDDGAWSLDDPVARHAPELAALQPAGCGWPPVRIIDLLAMASGLATDDAWADRHMDCSDADLDRWLAGPLRFAAPTGTRFEYSNLGYGLLGRLVRRATGRPVQNLVTERLLQPLGMHATGWTTPPAGTFAAPWRRVDGALVPDPLPPLGDGALAPMGGLWSTVADLARWIAFLQAGDDPQADAVDSPAAAVDSLAAAVDSLAAGAAPLSARSRREMQQVHRPIGHEWLGDGCGYEGYGCGLLLREDPRLGPVAGHSGGLPGYGSNMRWLRGAGSAPGQPRSIGVVALANVTYAPMAALTDALLGELAERGALPHALPAPALADAARALVALLDDWDDARAAALFTDNVDLDDPLVRRGAAARARVARLGRLRGDGLQAESATSGRIAVRGERGCCTVTFELAPVGPPRIQAWRVDDERTAGP